MALTPEIEAEMAKIKAGKVTLRQATKLLGKSYPVALRLVRMKRILAVRDGGLWSIQLSEIRRFLEQGNHPDALTEDPKNA